MPTARAGARTYERRSPDAGPPVTDAPRVIGPPPLLVLAAGNPARGDDALGPMLLDAIAADAGDDTECLDAFQFQPEHALDLTRRRAVLFVDASRPQDTRGVALRPLSPAAALRGATHALTPAEVLAVALRIGVVLPPCWLLAIRGDRFGLGEPVTAPARARLVRALRRARAWLAARRAEVQPSVAVQSRRTASRSGATDAGSTRA